MQNEIGYLVEHFGWENTALGRRQFWSETLHSVVNTCLHSKSPLLVLCGADLVIIYNEAFARLTGQQIPLTIGAKARDVWSDRWNDISPVLLKVLQQGKSVEIPDLNEFLGPGNSPAQTRFRISLSPVFYQPLKIEGVLVSVIENNVPQIAQFDGEDLYHRMIDEVQDYAIILMDKYGIIQNWNKGAEKLKLYKASEAVGKHFSILYLPEDRKNLLPEKLMNEVARNGRATHEGWRVRKDGSTFWGSISLTALHDQKNNIVGFSKVTRDLTDRKKTEDQLFKFTETLQHRNEALRRSEERYHKMIEEVQDYAIILLNENGDVQNWNTGAEKIKGYTAKEIIGKNFRIFYPEYDREKNFPENLLEYARKNGRATHEGWRLRNDGTKFWGSIVITTLHRSDGSILGFSKVTRDLTERKLAEDKMHEYMKELESQNRELEQFAYVASHDLQEPLRKIRTFTEVIEKNSDNEGTVKRYFDKIKASAQRMTELIQSVLNYSRLSKDMDQPVNTDLNLVLANVTSDLELLIQEKKAVIASIILPCIKGVPLQLNQLFSNLITNALKFSDKEPRINISFRIISYDQIEGVTEGIAKINYLELSFSDNGIGFDEQYEKLIFTMFQRLNEKQKFAGTGIGLAVCKKIVEFYGGFISAKSEVSKGSTFNVYLPAGLLVSDPL
ncbi:MAG TPA: PAS domain S-box protein [Flavitalea sp.]|nr:PAS domain S-box protein [Flavitalea sp.]